MDRTATSSSVRTFFRIFVLLTSHRRKHSRTVSAVTSLGTSSRSCSLSLSRSAQALGEISSAGGFASVGCGASETLSAGAGGFATGWPAGGATSIDVACASVTERRASCFPSPLLATAPLSFGCPGCFHWLAKSSGSPHASLAGFDEYLILSSQQFLRLPQLLGNAIRGRHQSHLPSSKL